MSAADAARGCDVEAGSGGGPMGSGRDVGGGGGGMEGLCVLRLMLVMKARTGGWTIGEKPKPYLERDLIHPSRRTEPLTPFSCPLGLYWIHLRRPSMSFSGNQSSSFMRASTEHPLQFYPRKRTNEASQEWKGLRRRDGEVTEPVVVRRSGGGQRRRSWIEIT